jgi:phosphopantothenoylcysteine decarboxylase/phosphopantothenate--cysteine ligase
VKRILLIVSGGIAAYKTLELVRLLRSHDIAVRAILTKAGAEFVTPLSLATLTEDRVYTDLWSLTDEAEMGHIQLSRSADLVVVAPASADLLAKMAHGLAGDLASTTLLATDKKVLVAPAMNVRMWEHAATQANVALLRARGVEIIGPEEGPMACGEFGFGRLAEPEAIATRIEQLMTAGKPLAGRRALVTSGPTYEPIDPVRFIGNRSSGKQGHAIAAALATLGADVTLVSGPTSLPDPPGLTTLHVTTGHEMLKAAESALPADIIVANAAVADWYVVDPAQHKVKKGEGPPHLKLAENPDILAQLAKHRPRARLIIGFAAETADLLANAAEKRQRKGCDWIVANPVDSTGSVFGAERNTVTLLRANEMQKWPEMTKNAVAAKLCLEIVRYFLDT